MLPLRQQLPLPLGEDVEVQVRPLGANRGRGHERGAQPGQVAQRVAAAAAAAAAAALPVLRRGGEGVGG